MKPIIIITNHNIKEIKIRYDYDEKVGVYRIDVKLKQKRKKKNG